MIPDETLARRVLAYAPIILARRGATAAELANRAIWPTIYSRLVLPRRLPDRVAEDTSAERFLT
jgi:hypothetical protein